MGIKEIVGDRYTLKRFGNETWLDNWIPVDMEKRAPDIAYIEIKRGWSEPICLVDHQGELIRMAGPRIVWDRYFEDFCEKLENTGLW